MSTASRGTFANTRLCLEMLGKGTAFFAPGGHRLSRALNKVKSPWGRAVGFGIGGPMLGYLAYKGASQIYQGDPGITGTALMGYAGGTIGSKIWTGAGAAKRARGQIAEGRKAIGLLGNIYAKQRQAVFGSAETFAQSRKLVMGSKAFRQFAGPEFGHLKAGVKALKAANRAPAIGFGAGAIIGGLASLLF